MFSGTEHAPGWGMAHRMRTTVIASTLLALVAGAGCATAASGEPSNEYLALGDSVAFGYNPLVDLRTTTVRGYPEIVGERYGLDVTNLSCPGEASGGFTAPDGADNHCRENRQEYPLHASYDGTQLSAAVDYLREHDPRMVTIDLGANDLYLLEHLCGRDLTCIATKLIDTLNNYRNNLDFIFDQLRKYYDGPIIALAMYNPEPTDATAQYAIEQIDGVLAEAAGQHEAEMADGMAAFQAASSDPCKDGLLIAMPDGTCDVHPTQAGAEVLADAVDAAMSKLQ